MYMFIFYLWAETIKLLMNSDDVSDINCYTSYLFDFFTTLTFCISWHWRTVSTTTPALQNIQYHDIIIRHHNTGLVISVQFSRDIYRQCHNHCCHNSTRQSANCKHGEYQHWTSTGTYGFRIRPDNQMRSNDYNVTSVNYCMYQQYSH